MGLPHKALISVDATPYYHCVSHRVHRAFLCGRDERTGQSFEHRRQWIEDRILELSQIFAMDICAYAVMSNHYHVVLHINASLASDWNLHEVVERWHRLCKGSSLSQRFIRGETLDSAELAQLSDVAEIWRARLIDIRDCERYLSPPADS